MQIRLPRPKGQEPRRKRPPIVSTADSPICAICNRQISRYHCPTCNLPYCSLACYKSPQHEDCSEKFDRQSLLDEIKSAEGKTSDEKKAMMDMLKRFEEENAEAEEGDGEEGELEREELEKRLEGVDLDSLPPDELLALLSPSQQAAFTAALSDRSQIDALVTRELETEQPWWIQVESDEEETEDDLETTSRRQPSLVNAAELPQLPLGDDSRPKTSPTLVYNIVAVLLAYSYTLRTFALASFSALLPTSSERIPATELLAQLVPFLVERSTNTLSSLDSALEHVASRETSILANPILVALLLKDVSNLVRPSAVTEEPTFTTAESALTSHPLSILLRALSDIHGLFATVATPPTTEPTAEKPSLISRPRNATAPSKKQRSQATMASRKLLFYISFLSHRDSTVDLRLVSSISLRAERGANAREMEVQARNESTRQRKEDESRRKFIVEPKGGSVRFSEEREAPKEEDDSAARVQPRIVEIE
ncbi:hypothetical protein JCM16303_002548 [Sporobolomyces ruberrimus]